MFEICALIAAREFDEDFEWTGHLAGAKRAGMPEQTIQAIQFNRDLKDIPAKDALMIRFGRALFREHKVSPEVYAEVVKTLGQRGAVEAAWIMGDYAMAAVALRAVDQRNPDGAQPLTGASKYMERTVMKSGLILAVFSYGLCFGEAAGEYTPTILNVPAAQYPCVYPDHRAMFRVIAPEAKKVTVRLGRGFDMTKGPDGIWTVTTAPLVVGFHYYSLQIDGATVADPSTMTFFGSGWQNSGIEIPEPDQDADYYRPKDVPHGHVSEQAYYSKVTAKWRRSFVYTPPD